MGNLKPVHQAGSDDLIVGFLLNSTTAAFYQAAFAVDDCPLLFEPSI